MFGAAEFPLAVKRVIMTALQFGCNALVTPPRLRPTATADAVPLADGYKSFQKKNDANGEKERHLSRRGPGSERWKEFASEGRE